MDIYEKALALHKEHHGKMEINVKVPMDTMEDLSMAYTPGVAQPCREIHNNPETVYDYTWKGNSVAVVSDGTAVLGLGDIGPAAGRCAAAGHAGVHGAVRFYGAHLSHRHHYLHQQAGE